MSTLGLLVPATKGVRGTIQWDGSAVCHLHCVTTGGRHYRRSIRVIKQRRKTVWGLEQLSITYGTPMDIDSDQGTHFTDQEVQEWADEK